MDKRFSGLMDTYCSYAAFTAGVYFILLCMYADQGVHSSVEIVHKNLR